MPEQVRDVGKYVYELAEILCTASDSAATDVDAVANDRWTGGSATEFADGWSDTRNGGGHLITALAAMAEKLGVTAETYEASGASNASNTSRFAMSEFSVNLDDLDRIVARLSGLTGFINDHLDDIDAEIATLTGTVGKALPPKIFRSTQQWMTGARASSTRVSVK